MAAPERKRKISMFDEEAPSVAPTLRADGAAATVNPWSGRPYTQRYFDILQKRVSLPVYQQRDDFIAMLGSHQTLVLVGETGSGKTTQARACGCWRCCVWVALR